MECPHLFQNVKIQSIFHTAATKELACAVCSSNESPWICLHCGGVHCGRYINAHSIEHYKQKDHLVCMDCSSLAVFCYGCDEFVVNDTENGCLARLRQLLKEGTSSQSNTQENRRNLRPRSRKRCHSTDGSTGSIENEKTYPRKRRTTSSPTFLKTVKREKKVVGLRNLGNTCFMNAVLQSLSNIEEFCLYFKQLPSLESMKGVGRSKVYQSRSIRELNDALMAEELRKVIISLTDNGSKSAISPESLFLVIWKVVPRFRGYQQQDAHEFLRYMLDRLHTELLHLLPESPYLLGHKGRSSIVTSVFGGTLQSEVRCLNCSVESKKHDPFLDLSLDIPDKCQKKCREPTDDPSTPSNILDCLTSFIQVEELADTELYYCNNCKSKQRSTKRFWIRRLPNVLCLHLKRFRWNNFFRTKVDTNIKFPVSALDMSQFVLSDLPDTRLSGSNLYDLAAVIVHHGSGAGSGHYTAFAINDGQWFHFNDSSVRQTQLDVVAKCKPYILFYIKREFSVHS